MKNERLPFLCFCAKLLRLFRHSKACSLTHHVTDATLSTTITMAPAIQSTRAQSTQLQIAKNRSTFQNKKPLFVPSHALGGGENPAKRKDTEPRSQSRCAFVNMPTDSKHTCVRVSNLGQGRYSRASTGIRIKDDFGVV